MVFDYLFWKVRDMKKFDIVVKFDDRTFESTLTYRADMLTPQEQPLVDILLNAIRKEVLSYSCPWEYC